MSPFLLENFVNKFNHFAQVKNRLFWEKLMYDFKTLENKYKEVVNNQKESIEELKNNLLKNFHNISRDDLDDYKSISSLYETKLSADIQLFDENLDRFENYENWLVNGRFI